MSASGVRSRTMLALDAAVALAATVFTFTAFENVGSGGPSRPVAYGLVLAHTLPIALRRRLPLTVLGTCVVSGLLLHFAGVPAFVPGPVILLPIYTVATTYEPPRSLAALAVAAVALAFLGLDLSATFTWALIMGGAWLLGNYVRTRRIYTAALEERAAQLEQARHELARRAVTEERLRIARELHDVVAHAMSLIAVQSGVGAHVIDSQPEEARKALAAIEVASREALTEMRRLLGVLRDEGEHPMSLAPAPGLARLDELVAHTAEAGVTVELERDGVDGHLPAGIDLAAYRIVQEALTNVVKHARARRASVAIRATSAELTIEVTDDGRAQQPPGPSNNGGHGIIGMRERASLYGGTLDAGPRPEGGFTVKARLPLGSR